MWGKRIIAGALASALLLGWSAGAGAAETSPATGPGTNSASAGARVDFSSGTGMSEHAKSGYGTATVALGRALEQDGWRLRFSGGYGEYAYTDYATAPCDVVAQEYFQETGIQLSSYCPKLAGNTLTPEERKDARKKLSSLGYELRGNKIYRPRTVKVETYEAAIMPGYQAAFGPFIVKAFAGGGYSSTAETSADGTQAVTQSSERWGPRAALETWLTLSDAMWVSFDASYAAAVWGDGLADGMLHSYAVSARLGYRALPWLTVGPEAAVFGERLDVDAPCTHSGDCTGTSEADDTTRMGGFARLHVKGTETTLSGGIANSGQGDNAAYGAASMFVKF